jgi:guanylate cyclase
MESFGVEFINFLCKFGYEGILRILGRNLRDFLNGLDNLHEYIRHSYPTLKPPSFFVEKETPNGLTLHYRSKRRGFSHYVVGQIKQVNSIIEIIFIKLILISLCKRLENCFIK